MIDRKQHATDLLAFDRRGKGYPTVDVRLVLTDLGFVAFLQFPQVENVGKLEFFVIHLILLSDQNDGIRRATSCATCASRRFFEIMKAKVTGEPHRIFPPCRANSAGSKRNAEHNGLSRARRGSPLWSE